jgi:hypothetical protein
VNKNQNKIIENEKIAVVNREEILRKERINLAIDNFFFLGKIICIYVFINIYVDIDIYIFIYTYACILLQIHMYMMYFLHVYMYIYTYINKYDFIL